MTLGVDKSWIAAQVAKATCPVVEGWKDGALVVFIPGTPRHYKGKGHRFTVSKHTKDWRERTASHLWLFRLAPMVSILPGRLVTTERYPWPWTPDDPKLITFTVYTSGRGFDGVDNLTLVCSPALDALGPRRARAPGMGLIDDDKNPAHRIEYTQVVKAAVVGIAIRVELLP